MSQSILHPALSAGILVGVEKTYNPRDSNQMKRGLYQFGSSYLGSSLENIARSVAPTADSMYLKPLAVGAGFTALSAIVDKQTDSKWLKYNMITSTLSEIGAGYLQKPVSGIINGTPMIANHSASPVVTDHHRF